MEDEWREQLRRVHRANAGYAERRRGREARPETIRTRRVRRQLPSAISNERPAKPQMDAHDGGGCDDDRPDGERPPESSSARIWSSYRHADDDFTERSAYIDKNLIWLSASAMLSRASRDDPMGNKRFAYIDWAARTGVPGDVSDALLRLLAGRLRAAGFCLLAGRSSAGRCRRRCCSYFSPAFRARCLPDRMRPKERPRRTKSR